MLIRSVLLSTHPIRELVLPVEFSFLEAARGVDSENQDG